MPRTDSNLRRRALLLSTAAVGLVTGVALTAAPALAQCSSSSATTVTCTSGGNPYAGGIAYTPATPLTVTTNADVVSNGTISNNAILGSGAAVGVVNNGTVATANAAGGVNVSSDTGNVSIASPGSITTTGANVAGARATTGGTGTTTVTTTGGAINASGRGIDASTTGTGAVTVIAGTVTGGGDAIHVVSGSAASGVNNAAYVGSTAATTTGATTNAISVLATGNISINSGTASSLGGAAISATSSAGNVVAVINGATTSTGADGIDLHAGPTGATSLTIGNATVVGTVNGANLSGLGGATVINNGTLAGGSGFAVVTSGGAATITNNGVLSGGISLGGAGNTVTNTGTLKLFGSSSFGSGGVNTLNNSGTVFANPGVTPPTTANLTGLTTFNNNGTVSLTNGNSLNLNGAAFNGGAGSKLAILGNGANGVLTVGSSTGTTTVTSSDLVGGSQGQLNLSGSTLVRGATAASNFALAGGPTSHQGFVTYQLGYNATGGVVTLYGLPGAEVFEALAIPDAAQAFWTHSADVWTARATEIRDSQVGAAPSRATGLEMWGQPYGGVDKHNPTQTFTFSGFNFAAAGTRYDTIGLQMGIDGLYHIDHGYGYVGVTAGLEQQQVDFRGDYANDVYMRGGNVGVYGGMNWYGLYANVLGKIDFIDMSSNFYTAGYTSDQTVKAYGGKAEVGYRWPIYGFFIEPAARVSGVALDFDDLHNGSQNLFFQTDTLVQAQAGGRIGFTWKFDGMTFTPYAGGFVVGQSSGRNALTFATGTGAGFSSIDLVENRPGTFTRVEFGVESANFYGLKTFLRGTNDFGNDTVNNWSAQMGVRFSF